MPRKKYHENYENTSCLVEFNVGHGAGRGGARRHGMLHQYGLFWMGRVDSARQYIPLFSSVNGYAYIDWGRTLAENAWVNLMILYLP